MNWTLVTPIPDYLIQQWFIVKLIQTKYSDSLINIHIFGVKEIYYEKYLQTLSIGCAKASELSERIESHLNQGGPHHGKFDCIISLRLTDPLTHWGLSHYFILT